MQSKKDVFVFYYDGFVEFEVSMALFYLRDCHVRAIALEHREYVSYEGQRFIPDLVLADVDPKNVDLLIIPGGDPFSLVNQLELRSFISEAVREKAKIAGICGGADLLVLFGFLDGRKCTGNATDPSNPEILRTCYQKTILSSELVVTDRSFITAKAEGYAEFAEALAELMEVYDFKIPVQNPSWLLSVDGWTVIEPSVRVSTSQFEQCNLSLVVSGGEAMLVDTGYLKPEAERVLAYLEQEHLSLKAIVITHHHIDHDQNMKLFTSICQTVYDSSNIGRGLLITIGSKTVSLFHTPGHFAKGDISAEVVEDRILIAGDILFSCLPSQLCYGSNPAVLKETIEKIASRHYRWIVPGHGRVMSGDALTDMTKNYIQKLESRLTFVVQNHGTVYDLAQIPLEDCISHFDWMVLEPSIDLHRQNKEELFEMLRCQIEKS